MRQEWIGEFEKVVNLWVPLALEQVEQIGGLQELPPARLYL